MKHILAFLLLAMFATTATAQRIEYVPCAIAPDGTGATQVVSGTKAYIDSIWAVAQSTQKITGTELYYARRSDATGTTGAIVRDASVLVPYRTAFVIKSSSISNSQVTIGSGVTTTFDTTGIVGVAVGPDTMFTVTVPASGWADGQPLILKCIYECNYGDTMGGGQILRTQVAIGSATFTFDSGSGYSGVHSAVPLTMEFTRVGSSIYYCPALIHMAGNSPRDYDLTPTYGLPYENYDLFSKVSGHANGTKFTSVDFTQPIVIRWITKWTTGHGGGTHSGNNTQIRMRSAGSHFELLQ